MTPNSISVPQPTESEVAKTGKLLLGIAALVIIGGSAAMLLGFFLGGGRALYRVAHGKPASTVYEEEFISLDLQEERVNRCGRLTGRIRRVNAGRKTCGKLGANPRKTLEKAGIRGF